MKYREDNDLEFLKNCSSEDLDVLVTILTKDKDGDIRFTEELTSTDLFKEHFPKHAEYWPLIAAELQTYAANSIATIFRGGEGVPYREALIDVCDKINVNYNPKASVELIEMNLLMKILRDSLEKMTTEDMKAVVEELDLKTTDFTPEAVTAALQAGILFSGFTAYKVALIVANAVAKAIIGRGLTFAANAGIARTIGIFAGPIGWAITTLFTLYDVAGPAYRVTIPAVIQVAFLRAKRRFQTN